MSGLPETSPGTYFSDTELIKNIIKKIISAGSTTRTGTDTDYQCRFCLEPALIVQADSPALLSGVSAIQHQCRLFVDPALILLSVPGHLIPGTDVCFVNLVEIQI